MGIRTYLHGLLAFLLVFLDILAIGSNLNPRPQRPVQRNERPRGGIESLSRKLWELSDKTQLVTRDFHNYHRTLESILSKIKTGQYYARELGYLVTSVSRVYWKHKTNRNLFSRQPLQQEDPLSQIFALTFRIMSDNSFRDLQGQSYFWNRRSDSFLTSFVEKISDMEPLLVHHLLKTPAQETINYWSDALAKRIYKPFDLKEPLCLTFGQTFATLVALANIRVQPRRNLLKILASRLIEVSNAEIATGEKDIIDFLPSLKLWMLFNKELPKSLENHFIGHLAGLDNKKLTKHKLDMLAMGIYNLNLNKRTFLRLKMNRSLWEHLKDNLDQLENKSKQALLFTKQYLTLSGTEIWSFDQTEAPLLGLEIEDLEWIQPVFETAQEIREDYKEVSMEGTSSSENMTLMALRQKCKLLGCEVTREFFDKKTHRMLDFKVVSGGVVHIIEFNGPYHFYYNNGKRGFSKLRKETARRKTLSHFYGSRVYHIDYFDLEDSHRSNTASAAALNKAIDAAFRQFKLIE